jgi:gamma-glutamyltranspeptidase/glutathione hydrolase
VKRSRYFPFALAWVLVWAAAFDVQAQSGQSIIRYDSIHNPVVGRYGMVVSQNELASRVGHLVLKKGGNAVDAAVAMGFMLAVTLPRAGNLGGSGFMLVHLAESQKTIALDYRSMAPLAAKVDDLREKYGSLPWKDLLKPAHAAAARGFTVTHDLAFALSDGAQVMSKFPSSAAIYLRPDGTSWQAGDLLVQKDLAWSIEQIMEGGADAFYSGELGKRLAKSIAESGGMISTQDLAAYRVREREVVSTRYRDHTVISMPPVSSGGVTLIQMLNMLQNFDVAKTRAGSAESLHLLAEVMKRAAANRRTHLGDPDFVDLSIDGYTSVALGNEMAAKINLKKAGDVKRIQPEEVGRYESRETTHFSVMDRDGNAVSQTYTLGSSFGSGYVAAGTGILMDNQMRNFSYRDSGTHPNDMQPGKRMLSTMAPTIVLGPDDKVLLVTGTPGGSRIINVTLQVLVNVIDHRMGIAQATHKPRIHQGWRSQMLGLEKGFSPDTIDLLEDMGHKIEIQQTMGSTQSILWRDGKFYGAADPRRPNALAIGLARPPQVRSAAVAAN